MTPARYVVLNHTRVDRPHFDLMYESEPNAAALTTLRCDQWPPATGDRFEEVPEHRRAYLNYEGPISGDRGEVSRVDEGVVELTNPSIDPPMFAIRLRSESTTMAIEAILIHAFDATHTWWTVISIVERGAQVSAEPQSND